MAASSVEPVTDLTNWRAYLDELITTDDGSMVNPDDQLRIETAIARGIAVLASEPEPTPATELPTRSILARDLRTTTDLVLRALQAHESA